MGEASFAASYTYSDGYYAQPDKILSQRAYDLMSFGAGLTLRNGIDARVWMRNALNTKIYSSLQTTFVDHARGPVPRTASKCADTYLRTLLIHGARAVLRHLHCTSTRPKVGLRAWPRGATPISPR